LSKKPDAEASVKALIVDEEGFARAGKAVEYVADQSRQKGAFFGPSRAKVGHENRGLLRQALIPAGSLLPRGVRLRGGGHGHRLWQFLHVPLGEIGPYHIAGGLLVGHQELRKKGNRLALDRAEKAQDLSLVDFLPIVDEAAIAPMSPQPVWLGAERTEHELGRDDQGTHSLS